MRIIFYFRAEILKDKGTPLRCRNLVRELEARSDIDLLLISADSSTSIRQALGVEHRSSRSKTPAEAREQLWAVIEEHKADVVYGRFGKPAAVRRLTRPAATAQPRFVADVHGVRAFEKLEHYWEPYSRRIVRYLKARAGEFSQFEYMDGLTVVSGALQDRMARLGKPIKVLWGGVDPGHFRPAGDPPPGPTRIIYAGNYAPYQGVATLAAVGRRLIERGLPYHFTLVGEIDRIPGVRQQMEELLGGNLTILGPVPNGEIQGLLSTAHNLTIPRLDNRTARFGFPSKLPEYLAMGRPVVATDVGEHARVIQDGKTGLIIPAENEEELEAALIRLGDPDERNCLGSAARSFAKQELTWPAISDQLLEFLSLVIETPRTRGQSDG